MTGIIHYTMTTAVEGMNGLPTIIGKKSPRSKNSQMSAADYDRVLDSLRRGNRPVYRDANLSIPLLLVAFKGGELGLFVLDPENWFQLISGELRCYDSYYWLNPYGTSFKMQNRLDIEISIDNHNLQHRFSDPQHRIVRCDVI